MTLRPEACTATSNDLVNLHLWRYSHKQAVSGKTGGALNSPLERFDP